ncbi:DotU family type IV/VI secretion system protein [Ralstonia sp. UBA689]|uniref:DotU family type IV/VI secretion system protein n=1 Tax=Ralstonia sp. UBA689 TaxID=1947373 RepID=UPI0025D08AE6|nr:DotU family type IV/VI secretion system protein [Ralstonia sp. UBA689]
MLDRNAQSRNHLLRLAQPLLWLLDELSPALESAARLDVLKSEVRARLVGFKAACQAAALKADSVEAVHYCFCAALDQAGSRVRGRADSLRGLWLQHGLLAEFYNENSCGQHCRAWIEILLRTPNASANALEVIGQLTKRGLRDELGMQLPDAQLLVRHRPATNLRLTEERRAPEWPTVFDRATPQVLLVSEERPRRSWLPLVATVALLVTALALGLALMVYRQHQDNQALASRVDSLSAQVTRRQESLEDRLSRVLAAEAGSIGISAREGRVYLVFSSDQGFASGRADITPRLARQLDQLATVLTEVIGKVTVIGHTDNAPGPRDRIESNPALSTARAMAVGRYLQERGVAPGRLSILGRGAKDALGDNRTAAGRALNRRVEIVLEKAPG